MNHYAMQTNAFAASGRKPPVLCPKPRRLSPLRCQTSQGSKSGLEFLDYFLPKGGESLSMSPPFFCGSPPIRAGNPVVRDARFEEKQFVGPLPSPALSGGAAVASPMSPRSAGKCARTNIGLKPAAVRIEGFNCRHSGCSITAVA